MEHGGEAIPERIRRPYEIIRRASKANNPVCGGDHGFRPL